MEILGIDFGGSGIKGAIVDTKTGELVKERYRIPTPDPSTPEACIEVIDEIVKHFSYTGPVGMGFPAVIQGGIAKTAANVDKGWIDTNIEEMIRQKTGCPAKVVNDADAAGIAEMRFGAGKDNDGLVLILTVGTGIGTAMFTRGVLVPNMELGHIEFKGDDAEKYASDAARKKEDLKWGKWGKRFNKYLKYMENLLWPDLIIIGGGVSKKMEKFEEKIDCRTKIVHAQLLNEAGIIGAAIGAEEKA
jgi:polyphosphate glucokinase